VDAKNDISSRFLQVLEHLISSGIVSSKGDFATKVGISNSMVTEISKGRSSVGVSAIQKTVLLFGISGDWLLTGTGDMLRHSNAPEPVPPELSPTPQVGDGIIIRLQAENTLLRELRDKEREEANELREANATLRVENRHLSKDNDLLTKKNETQQQRIDTLVEKVEDLKIKLEEADYINKCAGAVADSHHQQSPGNAGTKDVGIIGDESAVPIPYLKPNPRKTTRKP
jgi:transcriptional regulator with XRE-family HTH domain